MHITHWVPSSGAWPPWSCVESWVNMTIPAGATKTFQRTLPGSVKYFWNDFIKKFLDESKSDWLFSTHHDVTYVPETLERLLSWDKPLISALIFMRQSPVVPHIWKTYEGDNVRYAQRIRDTRKWFYARKEYIRFGPFVMDPRPDDALVPVDFTSTSCFLIHRSVLEAMRKQVNDEWFICDSELAGGGEDRRFCEEAKKAGFTTYVDRSCVVGHVVGDVATSVADFIAWDSVSTFTGTGEPVENEQR